MVDIDTQINSLKREMSSDLHRETKRIDNLLTSVHDLSACMENVEINSTVTSEACASSDPLNDPDLTTNTKWPELHGRRSIIRQGQLFNSSPW